MGKRKFSGNKPDGGMPIAEVDGFVLYNIPRYTTEEFFGFKLVTINPRQIKGNYWISYSRSMGRFVKGGDFWLLKQNNPDIADKVFNIVNDFANE